METASQITGYKDVARGLSDGYEERYICKKSEANVVAIRKKALKNG